MRVLIVDDDPEVLWTLGRYLVREGHTVATSVDATEAMSALSAGSTEVLVTDLQMPGVSGIELIMWARTHCPNLRVIAITAYGSKAVREAVTARGGAVYLQKPVDPEDLKSWIHRLSGEGEEGLVGQVTRIDLWEYLQLLAWSNRSGLVEVSDSSLRCMIYVSSGRVIHAEAGELAGPKAFLRCLSLKHGRFTDHPWSEPAKRTMDAPLDAMLLEAAQLLDESSRTS